ncbi:methyltransferase [Streptomyces sp. R11]|uniref:Methyltransferase n=1 Tax=Streptomyces sp. R11 TaxID=3238625 RepID=A0AB39NC53_9ACTN
MNSNLEEQRPDRIVASLLRGHIVTQLIACATRLGIPDHLDGRVRSVSELSQLAGTRSNEMFRFLRALQGLGLVEPVGDDTFRGTPLLAPLQQEAGGLYGQALMAGAEYYEAWMGLDYSLITGASAFEARHGQTLYELLDQKSDVAGSFARTMRWNTTEVVSDLITLHDFSDKDVVADLGTGDATLVCGLLDSFPGMRGIAFDQPAVIEQARRTVTERKLEDRCELVSGNFLSEVPPGASVYVLKSVLPNWSDESALEILRRCREAMNGKGRLLVVELVMSLDDVEDGAIRDMIMLVLFGGKNRTTDEYSVLLQQAGFIVDSVVDAPSGVCVLDARPLA